MKLTQFILIVITFLLLACGNKAQTAKDFELKSIEDAYFANPSPESFNLLMHKYKDRLEKYSNDKEKAKPILVNALRASEVERMYQEILVFLTALISDYPNDPANKERVLKLAQYYEKIPKTAGATILYAAIMRKYPDTKESKKAWEKIPPDFIGIEAYMDTVKAAIFNNPNMPIDESSAIAYIDACESLAMSLPEHKNVKDYIIDGAIHSQLIKNYKKAIWFYDWIEDDYGNSPQASIALFEKAKLYKNETKEIFYAKNTFLQYIKSFPEADSLIQAKLYLKELGWDE